MPRTLNVDIISAEQVRALSRRDRLVPTPDVDPPTDALEQPIVDGEFVVVEQLFAREILADPANVEVRQTFPRLATTEQIVQLCNIEGLEQLRLAGIEPVPNILVGYAYTEMEFQGLTLIADGGAYRTGEYWFHIRYRCAVKNDVASVERFEYALGPVIPEGDWQAHNLNADDDWLN